MYFRKEEEENWPCVRVCGSRWATHRKKDANVKALNRFGFGLIGTNQLVPQS